MRVERKVQEMKYKELPGLSERQLKEHHDVLYAGYVKKLNEIEAKMEAADPAEANATYSTIRELKLEETFATNAIRLHEGYFDNLGGKAGASGKIMDLIKRDFGSYEAWEKEFRALGICARGWVVLAYDLLDKRLHNYLCDVHNQGGVWGSIPILILDVYEHAYFIDYGTGRKAYIDAFMKNVEWGFVNSLLEKYNFVK
ncbi:MAG: Fe-Mn family superoxide dismutase [Candidatus Hydrothermarchaeota archaeon]